MTGWVPSPSAQVSLLSHVEEAVSWFSGVCLIRALISFVKALPS